MSGLLDLSSEVVVTILCHLSPPDLCSVALVCHRCRSLVAEEEVWVAQARAQAGVELRPTPTFSPRQFYQTWLHHLGPHLGLWQRTDLSHYGGLVRLRCTGSQVVVEQVGGRCVGRHLSWPGTATGERPLPPAPPAPPGGQEGERQVRSGHTWKTAFSGTPRLSRRECTSTGPAWCGWSTRTTV